MTTQKSFLIPVVLLLFSGCGSVEDPGQPAQSTEEQQELLSTLSSEQQLLKEASQAKTTGESQKLTADITSDPLLVELAAEHSKLQQALNQQQTMRGKPQTGLLSDVEQHHQEVLQRQMELLKAAERVQPN